MVLDMLFNIAYLTISHRWRGDHKPIFTERSEYSLVISDPEVTNCFSINSVLKHNNICNLAYKIYFTLPLLNQTNPAVGTLSPDSVIFRF